MFTYEQLFATDPANPSNIARDAWAGGGFTGYLTSYEGMKQVAVAAQEAAEAAEATASTTPMHQEG